LHHDGCPTANGERTDLHTNRGFSRKSRHLTLPRPKRTKRAAYARSQGYPTEAGRYTRGP
jgi:hypothetical protein